MTAPREAPDGISQATPRPSASSSPAAPEVTTAIPTETTMAVPASAGARPVAAPAGPLAASRHATLSAGGPTGPAGAIGASSSAAPAVNASTWSVLRQPSYRGLWLCSAVYFVGNAMQSMAAAWMMVELTGSSLLAALVQTAVFLPMFLLVLPAGVLADTADRGRLLQWALLIQVVAGTLLAALAIAHRTGPITLLLLVFVCGCCTALLTPAWNATINETLPREQLPAGITAIGISYNAARALGPALAGVVFTQVGGGWNYSIAVFGMLVMLWSIRRWPPRPHPPSRLPAERLWGGRVECVALRTAFEKCACATGAYGGVQRRGLRSVGAAAGDRAAAARAGGIRLRLADGMPGHRRDRRGPRDRPDSGAHRAGHADRHRLCAVLGHDARDRVVALASVGVSGAGGSRRRVDGGDVDLQHCHPDQRAALGSGSGNRAAHAVRAGIVSRLAPRSGARCRICLDCPRR